MGFSAHSSLPECLLLSSDSLCGDFNRLVEKTEYNDADVIKLLKEKKGVGGVANHNPPPSSQHLPELENILISVVILSSCVY